jgi:hypothetical protein
MLPRRLYELLPFIYIVTGILCAVLIDSTIVLISSLLLIITGVFVLIMRRNFRRALHQQNELYQTVYDAGAADPIEKRSGIERRRDAAGAWPVQDKAGNEIVSDRRTAVRRSEAETEMV